MILHNGTWIPDGQEDALPHALQHVKSLEWSLNRVSRRRVAIQAGGNIGLWPKRMADVFQTVYSFEPEPVSRECLVQNVPSNVNVFASALGHQDGWCDVKRKGMGSHKTKVGTTTLVETIDGMDLDNVDLIQLDVEGYEWHVLSGARETLRRCRPLVQVELRESMLAQYGKACADVCSLLAEYGYREVSKQQGSDVVFKVAA